MSFKEGLSRAFCFRSTPYSNGPKYGVAPKAQTLNTSISKLDGPVARLRWTSPMFCYSSSDGVLAEVMIPVAFWAQFCSAGSFGVESLGLDLRVFWA